MLPPDSHARSFLSSPFQSPYHWDITHIDCDCSNPLFSYCRTRQILYDNLTNTAFVSCVGPQIHRKHAVASSATIAKLRRLHCEHLASFWASCVFNHKFQRPRSFPATQFSPLIIPASPWTKPSTILPSWSPDWSSDFLLGLADLLNTVNASHCENSVFSKKHQSTQTQCCDCVCCPAIGKSSSLENSGTSDKWPVCLKPTNKQSYHWKQLL